MLFYKGVTRRQKLSYKNKSVYHELCFAKVFVGGQVDGYELDSLIEQGVVHVVPL